MTAVFVETNLLINRYGLAEVLRAVAEWTEQSRADNFDDCEVLEVMARESARESNRPAEDHLDRIADALEAANERLECRDEKERMANE